MIFPEYMNYTSCYSKHYNLKFIEIIEIYWPQHSVIVVNIKIIVNYWGQHSNYWGKYSNYWSPYVVYCGECHRAINTVGLESSIGFLNEFASYQTRQSLV